MYITVTRITAPRPALERMAEGFRAAAPDMRNFPGCLGLEVWLSDTTLAAVSRWESKEALQGYSNSPLFAAHHGGPSQGPSGASDGGASTEYWDGEVLF